MRTTFRWTRFFSSVLGLLGVCLAAPLAGAQAMPGNNAVLNSSAVLVPSTAYVDASAFAGADICARIHSALVAITGSSGVIDARGINTNLTCPSGKTPWVYTTTVTTPATILLPATTTANPILLNTGWTLPTGTRIIGEGGGANGTAGTTGITTIRACTSTTAGCTQNLGGPLISMGSATATFCPLNSSSVPVCTGISVENVWLDGQGLGNTLILNSFAQEQSYAKHVTLYGFAASGLNVSPPSSGPGTPQNSGPYSDITCAVGTNAASGTSCVRILNVSTRGIHGLSCTNSSATIPSNAIALDGPNNSIEDVTAQGFQYGVRIGATSSAPNNLLKNITGGSGMSAVVFITNVAGHPVNDIVVLGVTSNGSTDSIMDNRTTPATALTDSTVGMYVLGEATTNAGTTIGYSRFTTSPNIPTWIHGSVVPTPASPCQLGSLYSDTNGGSAMHSFALYVCTQPTTSSVWTGVK